MGLVETLFHDRRLTEQRALSLRPIGQPRQKRVAPLRVHIVGKQCQLSHLFFRDLLFGEQVFETCCVCRFRHARTLLRGESELGECYGLQYSENMRLISLTSSVRVKANISRMRDFCGLSVSAAT